MVTHHLAYLTLLGRQSILVAERSWGTGRSWRSHSLVRVHRPHAAQVAPWSWAGSAWRPGGTSAWTS